MESKSSGCSGWLTEFTNLPFVDFASVECHSIRNDRCLFSEVWHHKQFGSEDELVYNSTENMMIQALIFVVCCKHVINELPALVN